MSRFADQLPIITEPTPGNYLLGTDENDPKALVRIPAEGLGGGGSTEYTILDETALDVDSNVTLAAGLYLYAGNAPAQFDLSELANGERIEIINSTLHKCYLFGFANWTWNGVTTALGTNKALLVSSGIIAGKYNGGLTLLNSNLVQSAKIGFDPFGDQIVLYLKGEGADGSTSFIDDSPSNGNTISVVSGSISTAKAKYGSSSIYVGSNSSGSINITGANLTFNSGEFTIEFWHNKSVSYDSNSRGLIKFGGHDWFIYGSTMYLRQSSTEKITPFAHGLIPNSWAHIAISCSASTIKVFIDGILKASATRPAFTATNVINIGFSSNTFCCDSLRITKADRYAANFNFETDTFLNV